MVAKPPCFDIVIAQMGREEDNLGMPQWQGRSEGRKDPGLLVTNQKCSGDYQGGVPQGSADYHGDGCSRPGPACSKPGLRASYC